MSAVAQARREPAAWRMRLADLRGRGVYAGWPDAHRCIFIHVPKTAGSSMAESLFGSPSRHVAYTEYLRANPRKFRRYFKFAFVRDPFDRLVSTWSYLKGGGMTQADAEFASHHLARFSEFGKFVLEGLDRSEIISWVHFRPQSDFLATPEGAVMVDFVGRFERLEEDFAFVAKRLGIAARLPKANSSGHAPFASCYSPETAAVVAKVYARDLDAFSYQSPSHLAS
jgi:chondroitin 4-sulfotransferase 11